MFLIFFTILVILAFFLYYVYYPSYNKKLVSNFKNAEKKRDNHIESVLDHHKTKFKFETSLTPFHKKYNNYNQAYYLFLLDLFNALSSNKKNFKKDLVEDYPKNTLDFNVRERLDFLVKPVLKKIKELAPMTDFWNVGYESFKVYNIDDSQVKLNEIDMFLYDRKGWVEVRLLLKLIEIPKATPEFKPTKETCAKYTTPEFPTYFIGYPTKNQMIPLPSQVIITEKMVLSEDGTNYPVPCPYEKLIVDTIEIVNSNLVLNAFEEYHDDKRLPGANPIPYDFTVWKGGIEPYQDPNRVENKWPTILTQPKDLKAWPCTPIPFVWNLYGTSPEVKPTKTCPGIRTALRHQPLAITVKYVHDQS